MRIVRYRVSDIKIARLDTDCRAFSQFSCRKCHSLMVLLKGVENEAVLQFGHPILLDKEHESESG